eukprot:7694138-Alexandrium_andersonii.AAC.1
MSARSSRAAKRSTCMTPTVEWARRVGTGPLARDSLLTVWARRSRHLPPPSSSSSGQRGRGEAALQQQ